MSEERPTKRDASKPVYQVRGSLLRERDDLSCKISIIERFLDDPEPVVSPVERRLLSEQVTPMRTYLAILDARMRLYDLSTKVEGLVP